MKIKIERFALKHHCTFSASNGETGEEDRKTPDRTLQSCEGSR